jgi:predicted dinucleotide-binding enzyme
MSYAIVGFGKIGQALARAFARKKIDVTVASHRAPETLALQARTIGSMVVAKSLRDALAADTIILAVPFGVHREIAKALPSWKGKTVIDAMNSFPVPPEELDGLPSSAFAAKAFTGAKLVKVLITCLPPPWLPIRSSRAATGSSFSRATTRTRSLSWRPWPNASGSHPSSWESSTRVAR